MVIEEFGYSRSGNQIGTEPTTESRDIFYSHIFKNVVESDCIAGCNFWGWAGTGSPRNSVWKEGDDYLCDPPHEPQGWYSVFDTDTTTINVIKKYSEELK